MSTINPITLQHDESEWILSLRERLLEYQNINAKQAKEIATLRAQLIDEQNKNRAATLALVGPHTMNAAPQQLPPEPQYPQLSPATVTVTQMPTMRLEEFAPQQSNSNGDSGKQKNLANSFML